MSTVAIAAIYRFLPLTDLLELRETLSRLCARNAVTGTLLLAPEGFNGTLAGPPGGLAVVLDDLRRIVGCPDLHARLSTHDAQPFRRLKVRVKREIVTLGMPGVDPTRRTGTPVAARDWNRLLDNPEIPVIDVRNAFEHAVGTFAGAVDPGTTAFGDFPAFVRCALDPSRHKAVAMFCTGGIRCEKASAFMLDQGFQTVYQLDGGILAYLADVPAAESLWRGDCFVFDERGAVGPGLAASPITLCPTCSWPVTGPVRERPWPMCNACGRTQAAAT